MSLNLESLRVIALLAAVTLASPLKAADEPAAPEDAAQSPPAAEPAVERAPLPSRSDAIASGLLHQLPKDEPVSLKGGDHEFIALWHPANVGDIKGVVILLPGEGESADWPQGIGPLRRGLPDYGWHTLSLSLPDSPSLIPPRDADAEKAAVPDQSEDEQGQDSTPADPPSEAGYLPEETAAPSTEPAASTSEPAETGNLDTTPERITERIEAALGFARGKQSPAIVMLGQGNGAYWAARYLNQQAPKDVTHLVIIQPRQPEGQDEPLAQLVTSLKLATGDFYYDEGSGNRAAARDRLNASRRIKQPGYRQVLLAPRTGDRASDQEQLLRRIRGWLNRSK